MKSYALNQFCICFFLVLNLKSNLCTYKCLKHTEKSINVGRTHAVKGACQALNCRKVNIFEVYMSLGICWNCCKMQLEDDKWNAVLLSTAQYMLLNLGFKWNSDQRVSWEQHTTIGVLYLLYLSIYKSTTMTTTFQFS